MAEQENTAEEQNSADEQNTAEEQDAANEQLADSEEEPKHKKRLGKGAIAGICAVVLVAVIGLVFAGFASGVLKPMGAAAKYNLVSYISEAETTEYIETYKDQMGYGEGTTDKDWAAFLAVYNMTPERLRASTIDQLLTDKIVQEKCDSLGITVSDEELAQAVEYYKATYASGSDEIWQQTLEEVGQTQEGFEKSIKLSILKQKLTENQVPDPQPTDDQVVETVQTFIETAISNDLPLTLKHTYCFKKSKSSSEGSLAEREDVEAIRDGLVKSGLSKENFAAIVAEYSDDEDLKASSGANGWNADTSQYPEEYVKALSDLGQSELSPVFADDEAYYFIWVSDTFKLPKNAEKFTAQQLEKMPSSLRDYFTDSASYVLWQADAQEYLGTITEGVDLQIFPMPADVSYNVDMSIVESSGDEAGGADADSNSAESTQSSTE